MWLQCFYLMRSNSIIQPFSSLMKIVIVELTFLSWDKGWPLPGCLLSSVVLLCPKLRRDQHWPQCWVTFLHCDLQFQVIWDRVPNAQSQVFTSNTMPAQSGYWTWGIVCQMDKWTTTLLLTLKKYMIRDIDINCYVSVGARFLCAVRLPRGTDWSLCPIIVLIIYSCPKSPPCHHTNPRWLCNPKMNIVNFIILILYHPINCLCPVKTKRANVSPMHLF